MLMNLTSPYLIMLVGLPGCGKSTWRANWLQANPNTVVISSDDYIDGYASARSKTYGEVFKEAAPLADKFMYEQLAIFIKKGVDIIWDQTNLSVSGRAKKLEKIPFNYTKYAMYFDVPKDELLRRQAGRPGKEIPTYVMDHMMESYVFPDLAEGFRKVSKYGQNGWHFVHTNTE